MQHLVDILKISLPALFVFGACYYTLRQYIQAQYNTQVQELNAKYAQNTVTQKLQAYERLLLFCERISIPNLILRLNVGTMSSEMLYNNLLITIQKEFEHNLTQQLYITDKLWQIIQLAKDQTLQSITQEFNNIGDAKNSSSNLLASKLLQRNDQIGKALDLAIQAIKKEARLSLAV